MNEHFLSRVPADLTCARSFVFINVLNQQNIGIMKIKADNRNGVLFHDVVGIQLRGQM